MMKLFSHLIHIQHQRYCQMHNHASAKQHLYKDHAPRKYISPEQHIQDAVKTDIYHS